MPPKKAHMHTHCYALAQTSICIDYASPVANRHFPKSPEENPRESLDWPSLGGSHSLIGQVQVMCSSLCSMKIAVGLEELFNRIKGKIVS